MLIDDGRIENSRCLFQGRVENYHWEVKYYSLPVIRNIFARARVITPLPPLYATALNTAVSFYYLETI